MLTCYSPVRHSVNLTSVRKLPLKCFVRLACVRRAASVRPEPGSNSFVYGIKSDLSICSNRPYTILSDFSLQNHCRKYSSFSLDAISPFRTHGLFCVSSRSLSMNFRVGFFVCMLFNFQGSDHRSFAADLHSTTTSSLCQSLFHNFFELFSFVLLCFFVLDAGFGGAVSRQP